MARRRRKQLGSSAGKHSAEAELAAREITRTAERVKVLTRNKQCTAATISYSEMQQAIGRFDAHNRSGGKAWKPATDIREAGVAYNDVCVRESGTLSGRRRRRR